MIFFQPLLRLPLVISFSPHNIAPPLILHLYPPQPHPTTNNNNNSKIHYPLLFLLIYREWWMKRIIIAKVVVFNSPLHYYPLLRQHHPYWYRSHHQCLRCWGTMIWVLIWIWMISLDPIGDEIFFRLELGDCISTCCLNLFLSKSLHG